MEARPLCALLAVAMLVGQVAGFSQFPGAASEESGDLRASRMSYSTGGSSARRYEGGATGCSYMRPSDKTGCPMLRSGCIEPAPVPGQCAMREKDVASVCGADPACGGVVCRAEFNGIDPWRVEFNAIDQYCLARWAIDETATNNVHWSYTRVPSCTFIRGLEPGPLPAATPPRPARYTDRAPPRRRSEARDGR